MTLGDRYGDDLGHGKCCLLPGHEITIAWMTARDPATGGTAVFRHDGHVANWRVEKQTLCVGYPRSFC